MATIKATVVVKRPVAVTIKRHVVNVSVGKAGPQGPQGEPGPMGPVGEIDYSRVIAMAAVL